MIMRVFRRRRPSKALRFGEEGSALVELALSLPLLCLMLLGAAEFARLAYASIEVVNGAHAGAMYAASSLSASGDYQCAGNTCSGGITNAAIADAGNLQGGNAISVTSVTTACTCSDTAFVPSSCNDNQTCINNNASMITTVTVQTQATFSTLIHIPGGTPTFTLHGQSTQVVSNE
jgi:Flp pilus assembly protein TadG